jgi:UMF1 family MFS transporter
VSGWGWSFGYLGGMLTLGLSLAWVLSAQARGETASQFVPVTMLITAVVYALAAIATFVLLRERAVPQPQAAAQGAGLGEMGAALSRLARTWRQARQYRDFNVAAGLRPGLPGRHLSGDRAWRRSMPSRPWASSRPRP